MSFAILGLGTALPPHAITQSRAAEVAQVLCCRDEEQSRMLPNLYRHTGIERRHLVVGDDVMCDVLAGTRESRSIFLPSTGDEGLGPTTGPRMRHYAAEAVPLAVQAAQPALAAAGIAAAAITHLITVSCTGFFAPGVDVGLIKRLGLRATVQRTHVGFMGCHGAVNGLRVAQAFADADPSARILLCAVELCSLHFHYQWNPKRNVANALFGDGAAAVAGAAGTATAEAWQVAATGSCLFPDSEHAMQWSIGDHGFDMVLSTRIPALIFGSLRPWLEAWLKENGLGLRDVASWAVHPGGPRILSAVEECLCLPADALADSRSVLADCGNMSSPTLLFIIDRMRERQAPRPCVALGFGPGLVAEAALIR